MRRDKALVSALLTLACVPAAALATGYASGITQTGTNISFVLNQDSQVQVVFDGGAGTLNLGPQTKGTHSFDMAGYSSYQIKVSSSAPAAWTQIGTDSFDTSFWTPLGVSVNRNAASPFFGTVYVSNAVTGTPAAFGRNTPEGIYALSADNVALGNTPAGVAWGAGSGPFKSTIGADDRLYVADLSNDLAYEIAPDLSSNIQLIDASNRTGTAATAQYVAAIQVTGTQATGDRKIYLVNNNYTDTNRRGVVEYNLGSAATVTPGDTGTQVIGPTAFNYYPMDAVRDSAGNWYATEYRFDQNQAPALKKFLAGELPGSPAPAWSTPPTGPDGTPVYNGGYAVDIYEPFGWVAYGNYYDGFVHVFDMEDGALISSFDAGNRMRDISFDAAGNLYTVDNSLEWLRAWSPGGDYVATTGSDGSFSLSAAALLAGDYNGDGFVGTGDLNLVLSKWGQNVPANDKLQGDGSGDGFVGTADLNQILSDWGQGAAPAPAEISAMLAAVPEPASLSLLALGTLGLLGRRGRRQA